MSSKGPPYKPASSSRGKSKGGESVGCSEPAEPVSELQQSYDNLKSVVEKSVQDSLMEGQVIEEAVAQNVLSSGFREEHDGMVIEIVQPPTEGESENVIVEQNYYSSTQGETSSQASVSDELEIKEVSEVYIPPAAGHVPVPVDDVGGHYEVSTSVAEQLLTQQVSSAIFQTEDFRQRELTEEDRKLAAALVAVQMSQQEKQQQNMPLPTETTAGITYSSTSDIETIYVSSDSQGMLVTHPVSPSATKNESGSSYLNKSLASRTAPFSDKSSGLSPLVTTPCNKKSSVMAQTSLQNSVSKRPSCTLQGKSQPELRSHQVDSTFVNKADTVLRTLEQLVPELPTPGSLSVLLDTAEDSSLSQAQRMETSQGENLQGSPIEQQMARDASTLNSKNLPAARQPQTREIFESLAKSAFGVPVSGSHPQSGPICQPDSFENGYPRERQVTDGAAENVGVKKIELIAPPKKVLSQVTFLDTRSQNKKSKYFTSRLEKSGIEDDIENQSNTELDQSKKMRIIYSDTENPQIKMEPEDFMKESEEIECTADINMENDADMESEEDGEGEMDALSNQSKKSLPHKKRISRKLKTPKKVPRAQIKMYKCNKCTEFFQTQQTLNIHKQEEHTKKKDANNTFSCALCGEGFSQQLSFFEHLKSHYEPLSVMEVKSEVKDQLQSPEAADKDIRRSLWKCLSCGRKFRKENTYQSHIKTCDMVESTEQPDTHERAAKPKSLVIDYDGDEEPFEELLPTVRLQEGDPEEEIEHCLCEICNLTFENKSEYSIHMKVEHIRIKKRGRRARTDEDKKVHSCTECGRVFNHRNSLVYHMRSHTGERPHQCEKCGKSFFAASALKVHMRLHSGDKPYKCDQCGRYFRQWGDLKYHSVSIHSDEKQFQCEYCGKEFARKYSLVVHRRIHTGERDYKCEFCAKSFRAASYLLNHRRIHTGEKPHPCDICGKPFRVRSDMKRHMQTHNRDNTGTHSAVSRASPVTSSGQFSRQTSTSQEHGVIPPPQTIIIEEVVHPEIIIPEEALGGSQPVDLNVGNHMSVPPRNLHAGSSLHQHHTQQAAQEEVLHYGRSPLEPVTVRTENNPNTLYVWPVFMN